MICQYRWDLLVKGKQIDQYNLVCKTLISIPHNSKEDIDHTVTDIHKHAT